MSDMHDKRSDPYDPPLPKKPKEKLIWNNLCGSAFALSIASAASRSSGPIVVITPDPQSANRLEHEIRVFLGDENELHHFPDWETLPYDNFSPHQDILSDRLAVLSQLPTLKKGIIVVPVTTILHYLTPQFYIGAHSLNLASGQTFDWEAIRQSLQQSGYNAVSQVISHGEFATRGSIVDIFPMGSEQPVRIDLFDNEIESLRLFDPDTQLSLGKIERFTCLPAREFPLTPEAISHFRQSWRSEFSGDPQKCPIYQDISQGTPSQGIEYYLPLFFDSVSTFFDYLPPSSLVVRTLDIENACQQFWKEVQTRYEQYGHDIQRPLLAPEKLFLRVEEFFSKIKLFQQIELQKEGNCFDTLPVPDVCIEPKADLPTQKLQNLLAQTPGKVLLCAESAGRRETILDLMTRHGIHPKVYAHWRDFFNDKDATLGLTVASLQEGMWLPSKHQIWIAESHLYGYQIMQRRRRQKAAAQDPDFQIKSLSELIIGAPLVHIDHGVGRYKGLVYLTIDNITAEYLLLEYADNDKLYVPVSSLHLISQYSGAQVNSAPLHKLGTDQWDKAKKKASEKAHDVAAELLDLYAHRQAKKGFQFSKPNEYYLQFASSFPFEETPDQAKAIQDVIDDMQREGPMDRLVCGDVGFGKTEVALRAAFLAVQDGKQVVILVPTTLLAQQHFETFSDRFADWPIKVDVLSRFRNKKEQESVLAGLTNGTIDIIIGTHKLIQDDVKFKNLGLVIIDEEHRFGVKQKERLKSLRAEVDVLTLTATPIPRTLNMALATLRDLSIIATPPAKRLSIKTFVREYQFAQVQEAIFRELMRGGQVYYLHNEVETIEKVARELSEHLPQARVAVAHGQMRERQLEQIMSDFYHQRFNVLVCTTIIETGIDVPTANTIIIDRADKLGLAQLHQLRGRVGRSHHQAYAYCFTPPPNRLSSDATKRLQALEASEELGSGFTLATHDLEIRGAGELLGEGQSGNIEAIGFSLYMELLERAVKSLQSGTKLSFESTWRQGAEVSLQISALIPEDYLPDVHSRLVLYKRISNASTPQALEDLQVEMIDRFGLLPISVKNLFKVTEIKLKAQPLGVRKIEAGTTAGKIEFEAMPNINPDKVIELIRSHPKHYKLVGSSHIRFMFDMQEPEKRFQVVETILSNLA
jgi:transcription-repair coupling factor (superfamily II helicase)